MVLRMLTGALFCLTLLLLALPTRAQTPVTSVDNTARQIMVMLRLPPARYRPGGSYTEAYAGQLGQAARSALVRQLAQDNRLTVVETWPMPLLGVDCVVMALGDAQTDAREPEQVARSLENASDIAWAQPMHLYHGEAAPNDPLFSAQPVAEQWHLAQLHQLATGKGVTVAVVDSGIDATHPDLLGQVRLNLNFVDAQPVVGEWHGTAVAGVIAALSNNGIGVAGVAPRAQLLGLRACWQTTPSDTVCNTLSLAKALHAAVTQSVQIINMSLSGPEDRLLAQLLTVALARNIRVVAAVPGPNGGGGFPASLKGVIAVGAGPPLAAGAVQAPGRDVPTTVPTARWALVSGSSYAAAHVSGLLALVRELAGTTPGQLVLAQQSAIDACATLLRQREVSQGSCSPTVLSRQTRAE